MESMESIKKLVLTAVFAALISLSVLFVIPIGPVPIVLANFFAITAGLVLGPGYGAAAVIVYLILGSLGLPIFSGGKSGLAVFVGPTGGYLWGYLIGTIAAGIISRPAAKTGKMKYLYFVGAFVGFALIFLPGLAVLKGSLGKTWPETLAMGLYPFILGAVIKMIAAGFAGSLIQVEKRA